MKFWLSVLVAVAAMAACSTVYGAADPNGPRFGLWTTAGDATAEMRLGVQWGSLELYGAPRYDKRLAQSGDVLTDVRAYGVYNAVSAEMVANMLGTDLQLPDGNAYAGLYAGYAFRSESWEAGWLAGARIDVTSPASRDVSVDWTVEYQQSWQTFGGDGSRFTLVTGPRFALK